MHCLELPTVHVDAGADGAVELSAVAVALSAAVLLLNGAISLKLDLGMHVQLAVASVRMVVQLTLLSYILKPIFEINSPWLVAGYGAFMMIVATMEAVARPRHTYKGLFVNTLFAMAFGSGVILTYTVLFVMTLSPWWEAQYVIPLLGMLLGNCTSSIALGLETVLEELTSRCDAIEWQLSMGANRWEATETAIRKAVKTATMPLLNQMSVMGLVAIPGMMTGQILAGSDPTVASRYQMLIMFTVGGSNCLAAVISIYAAAMHVIDTQHCFRKDKLVKRSSVPSLLSSIATVRKDINAVSEKVSRDTMTVIWLGLWVIGVALRTAKAAAMTALGSTLLRSCCCCFLAAEFPANGQRSSHRSSRSYGAGPRLRQPLLGADEHGQQEQEEGEAGREGHTPAVQNMEAVLVSKHDAEAEPMDESLSAGQPLPVSQGASGDAPR